MTLATLVPSDSCMDIAYVEMRPLAGADLSDCQRCAAVFSLTHRVRVEFVHNGRRFVAYHNDIIHNAVKEVDIIHKIERDAP